MLLTILSVSLMHVGVQAQAPAAVGTAKSTRSAKPVKHADPREKCLMATGADWARLGVDQQQILRVNAIQSTCLQDCVAARESGSDISGVLDRHIADLRTVLGPEQFAKWEEWCKGKIEAVE